MRTVVPPADRPVSPNASFTPERVIRSFLEGLAEPDRPTADDGLRTAYNLLAPVTRWKSGLFEGFKQDALDARELAPLVGNEGAERGPLTVNDDVSEAHQEVAVATGGGPNANEQYMYEFEVHKQANGKYEGCWLVEAVSLTAHSRRPGFEHMPTVEFGDDEIKCEQGAVLRDVLLRTAGIDPHNDRTTSINCNGSAVCGTCAVGVESEDGAVDDRGFRERQRLKLPPHRGSDVPGLRLACQTTVYDDITVTKHDGLWGQHVSAVEATDGGEGDRPLDPSEYGE